MSKKSGFILFFVLIALVVLVLFYQDKEVVMSEQQIDVENCSIIQTSCSVKLGAKASLLLDITPKGMPVTKPAKIKVSLNQIDVKKIEIEFISADLDYKLPTLLLNKLNDNNFNGKVFLSLCTLEKTRWIASLTVSTKDKIWRLNFPFIHSGDRYNDITKPYS